MPPVRKYMVGGYLVPGVKNAFSQFSLGTLNKKRRITMELYQRVDVGGRHRTTPHAADGSNPRVHKKLLQGFPSSDDDAHSSIVAANKRLEDDDMLIFRILKPVSAGARDSGKDDDDESVATMQGDLEAHYLATFSVDNYGDGYDESNTKVRWKERYRTRLQTMEILSVHSRTVAIEMGVGEDTVVRDFSFDSIQQADEFTKVFQELRTLQKERGLRQAAAHGSIVKSSPSNADGIRSSSLDLISQDNADQTIVKGKGDPVVAEKKWMCGPCQKQKKSFPSDLNILVEICSASNLPIAGKQDAKSSLYPCRFSAEVLLFHSQISSRAILMYSYKMETKSGTEPLFSQNL